MTTQAHIHELHQINGQLEHTLAQLRDQLKIEEWFELIRRDMEADLLRRQNMLQEHIRHATQILAERPAPAPAPALERAAERHQQLIEDDEEWCAKHKHGTFMGRCASCSDEYWASRGGKPK